MKEMRQKGGKGNAVNREKMKAKMKDKMETMLDMYKYS